ncbi:hypothetical protein ACIBH1_29765 [Nonomuraea sp. NPDC050663]|uniref:hypothetical protein n=1 Tax=Nonomuraea sp. NPDC050663 TaxID=3364370 RepID=UPI003794DBF3
MPEQFVTAFSDEFGERGLGQLQQPLGDRARGAVEPFLRREASAPAGQPESFQHAGAQVRRRPSGRHLARGRHAFVRAAGQQGQRLHDRGGQRHAESEIELFSGDQPFTGKGTHRRTYLGR